MKKILLVILFGLYSNFSIAQQYDMSDDVIKSSHMRSTYYIKDSIFDFGSSFEDFIKTADKSKPVVVHSHGCGGIGINEQDLKKFYTSLGFYFVMLDFHKRADAKASCTGGFNGMPFVYFGDLKPRLKARLSELVNHVDVLRNNGFNTIYATGHSEGGMVVQFLEKDVNAAISHSMICMPMFDNINTNPNNVKLLHLVSFNDPLLTKQNNKVCKNRENYTVSTSSINSHGALADPKWPIKIKEFLLVN